MQERQLKQYQMLLRLKEFGEAHAARFPDDVPARDAFMAIEEALNQLNTFAVRRLAAKRHDVQARAAAREALVTMMESISRTARLLKAKDPEFLNTFLMPVQESAEALLTTARQFVADVEPVAEKFRGRSMGKAFPENFKRVLQRFEEAIEGRERGKALTVTARRTIEEAISNGIAAAHSLDIIVNSVLGGDPVVIDEWERSRRIGHRVGKKPEEPTTPPATEPVVPSPEPSAPAKFTEDAVSGEATVPDAVAWAPELSIHAAVSDTPEVSQAAASDLQLVPEAGAELTADEDAA